jgi:DNA-binding transcriptional LysR family regulator
MPLHPDPAPGGAGKPRSARHASRQCRNGSNIPCGRLGVLHVSRLIFDFQDRYPGTHGEFSLTDEQIDVVRDGVDISMKLRTLDESNRVLVASPEYSAVRGRPVIPHGLTTREGVRMSRVAGSDVLVLPVLMVGNPSVPFSSRLKVDHGLAARGAFAAGRGIGPAYRVGWWLIFSRLDRSKRSCLTIHCRPPR